MIQIKYTTMWAGIIIGAMSILTLQALIKPKPVESVAAVTQSAPAEISVETSIDGNVVWNKIAPAAIIHVIVNEGKVIGVKGMDIPAEVNCEFYK